MSRLLDYTKLCATLVVEPGDPTGRGIALLPKLGRFYVESRWAVRRTSAVHPCVWTAVAT
jgi:hypothetical protein